MMNDLDDTELVELLLNQVELVTNEETFYELHGFTLEDYLSNRKKFTTICRGHADHIEQFVWGSGIARTLGGSATILAGSVALLGIVLAPYTVGASLGLTVGGVAAGILGTGTTVTAGIVKAASIKSDKIQVEEALKKFDEQETIINGLLNGIYDNLTKLSEFQKTGPTKIGMAFKGISGAGGIAIKGVRLADTVNSTIKFAHSTKFAKFANNVSNFIGADALAVKIAEGAAAPGFRLFGRAVVVAGTTTAKVFSGVFAAFGVGIGVWDVVKGAEDINGSDIANSYRDFALEYDEETKNLIVGIKELSLLLCHEQ